MKTSGRLIAAVTAWIACSGGGAIALGPRPQTPVPAPSRAAELGSAADTRVVLDRYCVPCHTQRAKDVPGGVALDAWDFANIGASAEIGEKVVRKLRSGTMPPP